MKMQQEFWEGKARQIAECGLRLPTPTSCAKATEVKRLRRAGIAKCGIYLGSG